MAELQLGVLDVAYTQEGFKAAGGRWNKNLKARVVTTGQVAEYLESQYHVMGTFYELKQSLIAQALEDGLGAAMQDVLNGRKIGINPMYNAEQKIEAAFRQFLDADEMQKLSYLFAGEPLSEAAARGVRHRFKRPYAQRGPRPAFVDTGLYRASFRAVVKL